MKLQSGHEAVPLEGKELERQERDWKGYTEGLVRLNPGGWILLSPFTRYADRIYNYKFRSSDVVIVTYPKCGTNWTQEIVWTMRNNPDLNHPLASSPIPARSPFIDFDMMLPIQTADVEPKHPFFNEMFQKMCPGQDPADGVHLQLGEATPDPRTIKVHLPLSLMSPTMLDTAKVIYVARNPKDVIISYFHHCTGLDLHGFSGSFEEFVQYFVDDDLLWSPYGLHMKEAWEKRDHPNLHIIFYEDLKTNTMDEFRKLNTFLNTNLTEKQLEGIAHYTSFSEMKARSTGTRGKEEEEKKEQEDKEEEEKGSWLFRKGVVGDWKGKFTPALEAKVDQWIQKNMAGIGFNFKYEG